VTDEKETPEAEAKSGAGAGEDEPEEELDEGRTAPFGWVSLVVIAVLIVGTWFLVQQLSADAKLQDCVQSGRRNCAPIEDTGH
jgi:hypothetical protein